MATWRGPVWAEEDLYLGKDGASEVSWDVLAIEGRRGSCVCLAPSSAC